ncbi:MAG: cupin domain-containing protein [Candidatus Dojkabacteria bacterium]
MNVAKILSLLDQLYPGKKVIQNKDRNGNVTEIICEISNDKITSEAVAVIDSTTPHYHKTLTETYEVIRGKLVLVKGKEKYLLQVGDTMVIEPHEIHSAEGDETWIKVTSNPAWTIMDHIVAR